MQAFSFYLVYPLIWIISRLPLRVLYFISDYLLYPVLYNVAGYRKKVVRENISIVFPDKSEEERKRIEVRFFHFLSDLFLETVKSFSISKAETAGRISYENPEVLKEIYDRSKGVVLTLGHVGNYEWMAQDLPLRTGVRLAVPYKKLSNPYFDKVFKQSREKGSAELFHTNKTQSFLVRNKEKLVLALANDQAAPPDKSYWTRFFEKDSSFFVGTEKIARQLDYAVVFMNINPVKRGHYHITFQPITETPREEESGFIMEQHVKFLEENIRQVPEYWLWSHKRWKHKKPEGFGYGFPKGFKL